MMLFRSTALILAMLVAAPASAQTIIPGGKKANLAVTIKVRGTFRDARSTGENQEWAIQRSATFANEHFQLLSAWTGAASGV